MERSITPRSDPTGERTLWVSEERGEVVVEDGSERWRYVVRSSSPAAFGWARLTAAGRLEPVAAAAVLGECLRDLDAEEAVVAATGHACERARGRGGEWRAAATRLGSQLRRARGSRRVPVVLFQKWWRYLASQGTEPGLSAPLCAERVGWRLRGHGDAERLLRRLGLVETRDGASGLQRLNQSVNYETGLALCRALDRDPVELGL